MGYRFGKSIFGKGRVVYLNAVPLFLNLKTLENRDWACEFFFFFLSEAWEIVYEASWALISETRHALFLWVAQSLYFIACL